CKLVGMKKSELIGKHQSVLHPKEASANTFKKHLHEKKNQILETKVVTKTGQIRDVVIKANLLEIGGRKMLQGIFRDVTEQKKTEKALREAYDIINKSPVVIFLWKNAEGWPIEFVSENVKKLFGYSAKDFLSGKIHYEDVIYPKDINKVGEEVETHSKEKGRNEFKQSYRIVCKDKTIKFIDDMTTIRRNASGEITHYHGIVLDKTEQDEAEKRIKKSEKELKRKNAELEKFNKVAVGRELKMIELKNKVKELERQLKSAGG
ncbi:PAS domain-containing protein, partial [Patescibacteria group bacterium]|nr:PAS domain-containing protein [Patescibacteria group bacterium]